MHRYLALLFLIRVLGKRARHRLVSAGDSEAATRRSALQNAYEGRRITVTFEYGTLFRDDLHGKAPFRKSRADKRDFSHARHLYRRFYRLVVINFVSRHRVIHVELA